MKTTWGQTQSISSTFNNIVKTDGYRALYRGIGISFFGSIPAAAIYFGSYEWFKGRSYESEFFAKHRTVAHLSAGIFAEAIACIMFVPIDVIKERR